MKKYTSLFTMILATSLLALFTFSCDTNWEWEESKQRRPDIDNTKTSIKITAQKISDDVEYINVYRKMVTSSGDEPVLNIGILYPSEFDADNSSYIYEDIYVEEGKKYKYSVRYYDKVTKEFIGSEWTEEQQAQFGEPVTYLTKDAELKYENDSLILDASCLNEDLVKEDFYPAIVLKTDKDTQVFTFEKNYNLQDTETEDETSTDTKTESSDSKTEASSDSKDTATTDSTDTTEEDKEELPKQYYLGLVKTLPSSFFNTDVTIVGIVPQKIESKTYSDGKSAKDKRIYWLAPETIKTKKGTTDKTSFRIDSQNGVNGYDYSDTGVNTNRSAVYYDN